MEQDIFQFGRSRKIIVGVVGGKKVVVVKGTEYMSYSCDDEEAQRMAIVQLYESGIGTQGEIAQAFGIHRNSVNNYVNRFQEEGLSGILTKRRGPEGSWKLTPELRWKVLEVAFRQRTNNCAKIQQLLKQTWDEDISTDSIQTILTENGFLDKKNGQENYKQEEFEFEDQPRLEFSWIEANEARVTEEDKKSETSTKNTIRLFQRSNYSQAERIYLDRLEQGQYSAYGGGLLFAPLLERYNFLPTIKRVIDRDETQGGYGLAELCLTLFYSDLFRFESMENFKTVYPEEFGLLIGKTFSPSIYTLRRFLSKIMELGKNEELIDEFTTEYLKSGLARWGVLYIDGHFLPYYGVCPISMGYHGVRKIPMKGSYNFLAVDEKYNPVLFLIRASSEDLLQKIPEMVLKAKESARQAGISEKEIETLTVIFDREGYSAELFRLLDGKNSENKKFKARFITWAKYSDRWVNNIKDEKFGKNVTIDYEIQKPEEIKYFDTRRTMNKYGKIRTIVIETGRDKRRAAIFVNDDEMKAESVVQAIGRRWGHENLIKELMRKYIIDYSPGYDAEEMEDQPMVENPRLKKLKQQRVNLKSELARIKSKFGHEVLEEMAKDVVWEEIKKKRILTIADIENIRARITLLDVEIDKLPQEVRFDEAHKGKKLVELNYEKKRFLDCIKIFTYHMEKKMGELVFEHYDRKKEIWPAVAMIVRRGAYVKLERGKLKVQLSRFANPEIDYAARHLCEDLNRMDPFTLDKYHLPIQYEVS